MSISITYYSIVFIISLFLISRIISTPEYVAKDRKEINRSFLILCLGFVMWSISVVIVGVSQNDRIDKCFLYIEEFIKVGTYVSGVEVCASVTSKAIKSRLSIFKVSSYLLYMGVAEIALILIFNKSQVRNGMFGSHLAMGRNISLIIYILFYIIVIFFYSTYTYMYYYACKNKREYYISIQGAIVVLVLIISLTIEAFTYVESNAYIPTMYFGMFISIILYERLIRYKRKIEYHESDYSEILSPLHQKSAFVCDDEGKIIFENTRAFVMRQTFKDTYIGRYLTDIFDISDYDCERLKEPRVTQIFDVYCNYPKAKKEMILTVKHNIDKFGSIFSTEIEASVVEKATISDNIISDNYDDYSDDNDNLNKLNETEISDLRSKELINIIAVQKDLFEKEERQLFEFNLKGIEKASSVLGLTALEELCDRMQTELIYGEWESLNQMLIELDRQYETLSIIYS